MRAIQPETMPRPAGHYTPGMVANGLVFVSGQLPTDPATGKVVPGGITAQTERALRNVELVLKAAGSGLDRVVQLTIYISDGELWGSVNEVVAQVMGSHRPSRAIIPVSPLHYGSLLEVQAIALSA
ncbi:MAG TPA: Rid family hydrolase [Gemmatimonadales bacterium]|nr:Rid family hydrolase [Gemmatimonadales bacterium]